MTAPDIADALAPVVAVFERLGVAYAVVGSVASSAHGVARATLDVDLVADLRIEHVDPFVVGISDTCYVDRDAAREAVRLRGLFNAVHLATMLKVDNPVETPEDTILHKLEWYRAGGEVSERQWGDVLGILRVQLGALDLGYLQRWAGEL
mgnify:CR=1 FL=1